MTDERLELLSVDPARLESILINDDDLHDPTTLSMVESLDRWSLHGYRYKGDTVLMARGWILGKKGEVRRSDEILVSVVPHAEFDPIVEMARTYYLSTSDSPPLAPAPDCT